MPARQHRPDAVGLSIAALLMTGRIVYAWIFSADRAALTFTEAEVAFLFQAPVQRRSWCATNC
jgi:hypothetical protein